MAMRGQTTTTLRTSPFNASNPMASRDAFVLPVRGSMKSAALRLRAANSVALAWCGKGLVLGLYFRVLWVE